MRFIPLFLLLFVFFAHSEESEIGPCDGEISPIETFALKFPQRLHHEYEGYALVDIVLAEDGSVIGAIIKEEKGCRLVTQEVSQKAIENPF